jgi:hypothetical protein
MHDLAKILMKRNADLKINDNDMWNRNCEPFLSRNDRQDNGQKYSEVVMTDKTMAKRRRTNVQTTISKALHKKLKIKQKNTPLKTRG